MIGAIIGDIVGSACEHGGIKSKQFELFKDECHFTDDTVMTIAVAEAIWKGGEPEDFISSIKKFGRAYMAPISGNGSFPMTAPLITVMAMVQPCGFLLLRICSAGKVWKKVPFNKFMATLIVTFYTICFISNVTRLFHWLPVYWMSLPFVSYDRVMLVVNLCLLGLLLRAVNPKEAIKI